MLLGSFSRVAIATAFSLATLGVTADCFAVPSPRSVSKNEASAFVENKGQWDARAEFLSQTPGINQWVISQGLVLDFNRFVPDAESARESGRKGHVKGQVIEMSFINSNLTQIDGVDKLEGKNNYIFGSDESKWATGVRRYREACAEQPYRGISVRYYVDQGSPRYDLAIKPGADLSQVGLRIAGADAMRVLDNGDIAIDTSLGPIEQGGLTAYQETGSAKTPIPCRMISDGNTIRFDAGSYDPSKPLIIDPLIYSTMIGGTNGPDMVTGIACTPTGNAVVVGYTASTNFPTSLGAYQTKNPTLYGPATVTEFNLTGTGVVFSTFLGGSGNQSAGAVAVDSAGNPVVVGNTSSMDFPVTSAAYQKTNYAYPSGSSGFVTKLNATGSNLIFSSLLGGTEGYASAAAIALDKLDNLLIGGFASSNTFPTTENAFQKTVKNNQTCYLTKMNATGSTLIYSTLVGGSGHDSVTGVAFDKSGYAYLAGTTTSIDFPTTAEAYQTVNKAASTSGHNGFVVKFNANASGLLYSTYVGGSKDDYVQGLGVDSVGNAVVAGYTFSTDYPTTAGAFQTTDHETTGFSDGFITKLNGTGSKLGFSTFLGGSTSDFIYGMTLDASGNPVVTGNTGSSDFPTTPGAYQRESQTIDSVAFVTQVKANGTSLIYSSLIGGTNGNTGDEGLQVTVNSLGQAVITGIASSNDFPTTKGAYQGLVDSYGEGFVACFEMTAGAETGFENFWLQPSVIAGQWAEGAVFLNGVATTEMQIALSGSGPAAVPKGTYIAAGADSNSFTFKTPLISTPATMSVTAKLGSTSFTRYIQIVPMAIKSLSVNPSPLVGGNTAVASVAFSAFTGYGSLLEVMISTTGPVTTPPVEYADYGAGYYQFYVSSTAVSTIRAATLTVTMGTASKTVDFNVYPALSSFTIAPSSVVGGVSAVGTVDLYLPAGQGGQQVSIHQASDQLRLQHYPFYVPQGATTTNFPIGTTAVSATTLTALSIEAGSVIKTASLTLTLPAISSFSLEPSSTIVGGTSCSGAVSLAGAAGPSGDLISVSSNSPDVMVPATVTVQNGWTTVIFPIQTKKVTVATSVTIKVTLGSSVKIQTLKLTP